MKIPAVMWSVVLFKYRDIDKEKKLFNIVEIIQKAKLNEYEYLKHEEPYIDTLWDIANDLKNINIEENQQLKEKFFQCWKEVSYDDKARVFKNVDYQELIQHGSKKFDKQLKAYYLENMLQYPTIPELFRFRKDISQENLKKGLMNVFTQTAFNEIKNQKNQKIDYWENHINGKEADKLLDILELSGIKKDQLNEIEKIGFLNPYRQAKFDKINESQIDIPLIETKDNEVYLLEIKINPIKLLKTNDKLGSLFLNNAGHYIAFLMEGVLGLEKISPPMSNKVLKLIAYSKEDYHTAVTKRDAIEQWMENNTNLLIEKIKETNVKNKDLTQLKEDAKKLAEKIIFKHKLENNLVKKNIKTKNKI